LCRCWRYGISCALFRLRASDLLQLEDGFYVVLSGGW